MNISRIGLPTDREAVDKYHQKQWSNQHDNSLEGTITAVPGCSNLDPVFLGFAKFESSTFTNEV
jgi:hypothetical protein